MGRWVKSWLSGCYGLRISLFPTLNWKIWSIFMVCSMLDMAGPVTTEQHGLVVLGDFIFVCSLWKTHLLDLHSVAKKGKIQAVAERGLDIFRQVKHCVAGTDALVVHSFMYSLVASHISMLLACPLPSIIGSGSCRAEHSRNCHYLFETYCSLGRERHITSNY